MTLVPVGGRSGATVGTRVLRATVVAGHDGDRGHGLDRARPERARRPAGRLRARVSRVRPRRRDPVRGDPVPRLGRTADRHRPRIDAAARDGVGAGGLRDRRPGLGGRVDRAARVDVDLDAVRLVVLAIAIASIVLASVAAFIQDDIEHVVGYAIIGDAGVVLLAVAALDPAAWAPARTWILAFVVARSAFAAWAAATRIDVLHGAGRRPARLGDPVAGARPSSWRSSSSRAIGVPGLAAFDARGADRPARRSTGRLPPSSCSGTLSPLAYYGRLLFVGAARPEGRHPRTRGVAARSCRRWT